MSKTKVEKPEGGRVLLADDHVPKCGIMMKSVSEFHATAQLLSFVLFDETSYFTP